MSDTDEQIKANAIETVRNDPSGSVKKASTPAGRDYLLLSAIALAAQDQALWHELRNAGVVNLFITLLADEWRRPDSNDGPDWVFSLSGLINTLVSLKRDEKVHGPSPENSAQSELVRKAYPAIENALWQNRESANTDDKISVLALGFYHFGRIPGISTESYSPATLSALGHCWVNAKGIPARKISCVVLRQLLNAPNKPSYALNNFFKLTPTDVVLQTLINRVFLDPTIRSDVNQLGVELLTADAFVEIQHPSGIEWAQKGLHSHVIRVVQARLNAFPEASSKDDDEYADDKAMLVSSSAPILNNIINAAEDPGKTLEDLIVHHEFFDTASRALEIIAPRKETYDDAWFRIFKMLMHTIRCSDLTCRIHGSPTFNATAREKFLPVFIPTLDNLDVHIGQMAYKQGALNGTVPEDGSKEDTNKYAALWQSVLTWRALAAVLNVYEEVERGNVKVDGTMSVDGKVNVCWWAKCTTHKTVQAEGEAPAYKRCSACHAVMYCSSEHQKMDWKEGGHKQVCAVIKNA